MAFETFKRQRAQVSAEPAVTIQKRGTLSLNVAAYNALEQPDAVELLYDRAQQLVALRKVVVGTPHAYPVRQLGSGPTPSTWLISGKAFASYYGIDVETARRWVAKLEPDGMLVLDLKTPSTPVPGNRPSERSPQMALSAVQSPNGDNPGASPTTVGAGHEVP